MMVQNTGETCDHGWYSDYSMGDSMTVCSATLATRVPTMELKASLRGLPAAMSDVNNAGSLYFSFVGFAVCRAPPTLLVVINIGLILEVGERLASEKLICLSPTSEMIKRIIILQKLDDNDDTKV